MKTTKVPVKTTKVPGKIKKHKVLLYTLSTCVWCKKTKQLLKEKDIDYDYVDIDQCSPKEQEEIKNDIIKRGGSIGFPCIIVDDKTLITGYREDKIKEALEL